MARPRRRAREPSPQPEESEVEMTEEPQEEEEEQEAEEEQAPQSEDEPAPPGDGDVVSLQFDDELTWRPGRPIPVATLLERLERLSQELHPMEQDHVDLESLSDVSHALGQRNLLAHKNEGVRAFTASCMVDILQVSAPEAPFTSDQLKMLFTLIVSHIFPALGDQSHPYHKEHKYVLRSLAEVQSILLINDVDGADDLLLRLFSTFFDTVSGASDEGVSKDVSGLMADILVALIEEASGVSPKVIEVIMAQFLRAAPPGGVHARTERGDQNGQSTLLLKSEPPAYLMAKEICDQVTEKMVHYVSQYFSDVIIDASQFATKPNGHHGDDDDDDDGPKGPTDAELRELKKAHLLIRELWRAAPAVLQNVIPQVEAELSADNVELRQIATETLGDMISGIGAAGPPPAPLLDPAAYPPFRLSDEENTQTTSSILTTPMSPQSFAQTHHAAYHSFIGRNKDKTSTIRAAWTTAVGNILSTSAGGIGLSREDQGELVRALGDKLNDSDERVRLAAVKAVELFGFRDFVMKLGSTGGVEKEGSILSGLADRCRDKRPAVRVDAMTLLGNLWGVGAAELAAKNDLVSCLSGIPSVILRAWYANDLELNLLIDRVVFEALIPLTYPPIKTKASKSASQSASQSQATNAATDADRIRAERILLLVQQLDQHAKKAFYVLQARQPQFAKVFEAFIKQCEAYNGGVMDEGAAQKKAALDKTIEYIGQFFPDPAKVNSDYHKFAKANDRRNYQLIKFATASDSDFKTVRQAIKELVKRMQGTPTASALDTLVPFLYRSARLVFNKSHLATILDYSKTDQDGFGQVAHDIMHEISVRNPDMFKSFVGDLCKDLVQQAPTERKENDPMVVDILRATSSFAKKYPGEVPKDKDFVKALSSYALYGKPVKAAKYAVKILLAQGDKQGLVLATSLFGKIMKNFEYDAPFFLNKLQCISQLYLQAPKVTQESDEEILNVTVQKIIREVRADASDKDPDWVDDANMDEELQAKCLSLRIAVNRLRSIKDTEEATEQAAPIFKLLMNLITKSGEVCKTKDTPKHHKARLRLLAAQLTLKLCTLKHFDDALSHKDFHLLAYVTQDRESNVRRGFVEKLMKYLVQGRLRHRFYTMIFLVAFEPVADFKQHVETWIRSRVHAMQGTDKNNMEALVGRLIPLLAHHPDYDTDLENLGDHARYLLFYVSNVATEENLGLIYRYAERVKQTRDNIDPSMSENLYVISDLAQAVIRKWQEKKAWTFQAYPGKVGLPIGLYAPLPSHSAAQEVARKQYIPDGIDDKLDDLIKSLDKKKKRKYDDKNDGSSAKKARTRELKAASTKSATPRAKAASRPKAKPKRASKPARSSSPSGVVVNDADRRRSGRARTSHSAYKERDSSDDEREMMDGVAQWKYEDEGSDDEDAIDDEGDEEGEVGTAAKGADSSDLSEAEPDVAEDAMDEDQDEVPAPAKRVPRKKPARAASKTARGKAKAKSAATVEEEDDAESSALSEPEEAAAAEEAEEEEADVAEAEAADDESDENEKSRTRTSRNGAHSGRNKAAAAAAPKAQLPTRPAKKAAALAAASAPTTSTRPRRGRAAAKAAQQDESDMDVDDE